MDFLNKEQKLRLYVVQKLIREDRIPNRYDGDSYYLTLSEISYVLYGDPNKKMDVHLHINRAKKKILAHLKRMDIDLSDV